MENEDVRKHMKWMLDNTCCKTADYSDSPELAGCIADGNVKTKTPWYRTDKLGWPIETVNGKRFSNFIRIVLQNIRKINGYNTTKS